MKPLFGSIRLSDRSRGDYLVLRKASNTRPVIWLVEEDGVQAVVKDYSPLGFFFRNIIGRFLVWRESKALRRLRQTEGVPRLFRVIDGLALVLEKSPGRSVEGLEQTTRLPRRFFDDLQALVDRCHERGVAHCDLKRAANILVDPNWAPHIIDWGASICREEFRFFPFSRIYQRFLLDDYTAVTKLKLRHIPEAVSDREKDLYSYRGKAENTVRAVRDRLRELLQKVS